MTNKVRITSIAQIIMALLIIVLKYLALWIEGFTAVFLFMFLLVLALILCISILLRGFTIFKTKKVSLIFTPLIGVLSIIIVFFDPIEYFIEKNRSPVLFSGYCEHTVTNVSFVFRQDSTFNYEAGAFLRSDDYEGKYLLKNDTVYLKSIKELPNINSALILKDKWFEEIGDSTRHRHVFKYHINNINTQ